MTAVYVETSAVLAWLFQETGAANVQRVIEAADTVVSSCLTRLEAERGLLRLHLEGGASEAALHGLSGALRRWERDWHVLEINQAVRKRAAERFPSEPVRSLDAIHLASALQFSEVYADLAVLSFDRRILANLTALGLRPAA